MENEKGSPLDHIAFALNLLVAERDKPETSQRRKRLLSLAITDLESAQNWIERAAREEC